MIYTIPDSQRSAEAAVADLAWRGISWPPCEQYKRLDAAPPLAELGYWGRLNNQQTELEATL